MGTKLIGRGGAVASLGGEGTRRPATYSSSKKDLRGAEGAGSVQADALTLCVANWVPRRESHARRHSASACSSERSSFSIIHAALGTNGWAWCGSTESGVGWVASWSGSFGGLGSGLALVIMNAEACTVGCLPRIAVEPPGGLWGSLALRISALKF